MTDDRISKLPKWAQAYIQELEQRTTQAEEYADALRVMIDGSPKVEPDLEPPDTFQDVVNGWLAFRNSSISGSVKPKVEKACTSSIHHSVGQWDKTRSQNSRRLFSSPSLALRSLLPQILKAYADEMATTVKLIKEYEQR